MNITNLSQVAFANSPVIIRINLLDFPAFPIGVNPLTAYLTITTFDIAAGGGHENVNTYVLKKEQASVIDTYISFDIQQYLKSDLAIKANAPNQEFPVLQYDNLSMPTVKGQCLFFEMSYYVTNGTTNSATVTNLNNVATLGYRWRNEAVPFYGSYVGSSEGFNVAITPKKKYNDNIPYYIRQEFDFTLGTSVTSANFIKTIKVNPSVVSCAKEPILIMYLNRLGLWEYITTFGKVSIDTDTTREASGKVYRDNYNVNPDISHGENIRIEDVRQNYTINTGLLDESMNQLIEELMYSPKVYLVRFYGDTFTVIQEGITVDNDIITVDNDTITVDSDTVTLADIGYFTTYTQVPVRVMDSNFVKRTFNNDKRDISYFIKFRETDSKIKN